ncbi:fluoride efflux transporter FluC [Halorubrum trueperi]|uniref:Fluoride-specific ion channel FluC n=1 Tax=Halorubrum trueperi TaxID=2004704 RepID=A0ABD5UMI1_9EURY
MTATLLTVALVGVGGAFGAAARHAVGIRIEGRRSIPAVNTIGSLALGGLLSAPIASEAALFAAVGFCGAFTTFSSFAVETVSTADSGNARLAICFAAANLLLALVAFFVGAILVGSIGSLV